MSSAVKVDESSADRDQKTVSIQDALAYAEAGDPEALLSCLSDISEDEPQKVELANRCGRIFRDRSREGNSVRTNDLLRAERCFNMAVNLVKESDPNRPDYLFDAVTPMMDRFLFMDSLEDGDKAINMLEEILPTIPDQHKSLPRWLVLYGTNLMQQFQLNNNPDNITKAMAAQEKAVRLTDDSHPLKALWLSNSGDVYFSNYSSNHLQDYLEKSIDVLKKALDLSTEGSPNLHSLLESFAKAMMHHFFAHGELSVLQEGISHLRRAITLCPVGFSDLAGYHRTLGLMLTRRFEQTNSISDLSEAISAYGNARQLNPAQYQSNLPTILSELGSCLRQRFELCSNIEDINEAISTLRTTASLISVSHPILPGTVAQLAFCLSLRYYRLGNLEDINQAIAIQRRLMDLFPAPSPSTADWLSDLGVFLSRRFERTSKPSDIAEAIAQQRKAVDLVPESNPKLTGYLVNLGRSYGCRFEQMGDLSDITKAIIVLQRAVGLPLGDKATCYNNLANAYRCRYDQMGDISDIQEAISAQQRALETLSEGNMYMPGWLLNLGDFLFRKYTHSMDPADINDAAEVQRRAVQATPKDHAIYPRQLQSLGYALMARYQATGEIDNINEAIILQEEAVRMAGDDHPQCHQFLGNLGNSYTVRFNGVEEVEDLQKGVNALRKALRLCPPGHSDETNRLDSLAVALKRLAIVTDSSKDLDESIETFKMALSVLPDGHVRHTSSGISLAEALLERFHHHSKNMSDLVAAAAQYRKVAISPIGFTWLRLEAAQEWIKCCRVPGIGELKDACECAIRLLALNAGMYQTVEGRHRQLQNTSGIVAPIVATAMLNGANDIALEWLEEGRCIVWNQINQLRSPLDILRAKHPALAEELHTVRTALDFASIIQGGRNAAVTTKRKFALQDQATNHVRLAKEWDRLLREIRASPEFHNFLQPKKTAYLMSNIPQDGIVVIINSHTTPCAALALVDGADEPLAIALPSLDFEAIKKKLHKYLIARNVRSRGCGRGVRRKDPSDPKALKEVLRTLWIDLVKPIFEGLAFGDPPEQPKRLWWCVMGALTFLPLHAAGIYDQHGHCASDYVISSYIPSVSMLIDKKNKTNAESPKILLLSQPNTPGMDPIPGTAKEVEMIRRQLEEYSIDSLAINGEEGTVTRVRNTMKMYGWVHLACHAIQDAENPLDSGFYLQDARLTLLDVIKEQIESAEFAFLSACQTSTGSEKLAEEAAHLAAGMLAGGYRSVVATMWSIQDHFACDIAANFYKVVLEGNEEKGARKLDSSRAAEALLWATKQVREKHANSDEVLLACIPFVHFGY